MNSKKKDKKQTISNCPKCRGPHDPATDQIAECVGCGEQMSTGCCLLMGAGRLCEECGAL